MKTKGFGWVLTVIGYVILTLGVTGLVLKLTMTATEAQVNLAVSIGDVLNDANILQSNPLMTRGNVIRLFLLQNRVMLMIVGAVMQILGALMRSAKSRR